MASVKQIIFVLGVSALLIVGIGFWINKTSVPPELLLDSDLPLEAPLSVPELQANKSDVSNTMNSIAIMNTNKGVIEIELYEDLMPITTDNFKKLLEEGFYNGVKFHRVIDGFMIQGGDPNTKTENVASYGSGGPGYTIQDEFVANPLLTNVRGTISMANTGQPNSGGSQFFINTADNTGLDFDKEPLSSRHPVFGRVIKGLDIVDLISDVPVSSDGRDMPLEPVVIESVEIKAEN